MWKKFTVQIVVSVLMLIALIIGITWIVDPFDIFASPKIEHFNANKPKVARHSRVYKACILQKMKPQVIFLGTSRTESGMDPNNKNFGRDRVFNCAISAGVPVEYEYYTDLAMKNGVKHIIIGLDIFAFYSNDLLHAGFDKEVFKGYIPLKYYLSLDAFQSSLKTIGSRKAAALLQTGRIDPVILQKDLEDLGSYKKSFISSEQHYFTGNYGGGFCSTQTEHWEAYERILDKAYQHNVKVTLFISPSHARQWEVLDRAQGYGIFEEFKHRLVFINEQTAFKNKKEPFALWDFSGYGPLTTEEVPKTEKGIMKWYWDSSHYKKELGDIVLDRMFDGNFSGGEEYPNFGVILTSKNIEKHLNQLRTDRIKWQDSHASDMQEIRELKK